MKSIEETWIEMVKRNRDENWVAYSSYKEEFLSNPSYSDYYEQIKKYTRWIQPDWTFPDHITILIDIYFKNFGGCRWTMESPFNQIQQGVPIHLHRTHKGHAWAYTIGIPYDINDTSTYDLLYYDYYEQPGQDQLVPYQTLNREIKNQIPKVMKVKPFTALSFSAGRIPHGTGPLNGKKWIWLLYDLYCIKEPNREINVIEHGPDGDPTESMQQLLTMTDNFVNIPFSEFYFFDERKIAGE